MSKTYYLKINDENVVVDALSFPYDGYVSYETDELPQGILGRYYKLENGQLVEYPELKPEDPNPIDESAYINEQVEILKTQNAQMLLALVQGGLM